MDAKTIDQEFEQLQKEFQDVAKTVEGLAGKMQEADKAGDRNATEWLGDLKQVAQEIDEEQAQVQKLLLALHDFIGAAAEAHQAAATAADDKPPLFAPGHEPADEDQQQQPRHHSFLSGWFGGMGGMGMGGGYGGGYGGYYGGYYGGGFGQAMAAGAAMSLGASLVSNIF
jgi:hypothetical protein